MQDSFTKTVADGFTRVTVMIHGCSEQEVRFWPKLCDLEMWGHGCFDGRSTSSEA